MPKKMTSADLHDGDSNISQVTNNQFDTKMLDSHIQKTRDVAQC